jgi:site-specific DNA-methyltransferase (adenine-specific)
MTATWIVGNTLDVLRKMPDDSVDLVMTSPPFLALRSYLPDDDPAKADEIGQEPTPGEFIDTLLDVTEELRRVIAPHGSICVELGDTYAGSGGGGGDYLEGGMREGQQQFAGAAASMRESYAAHWRMKNQNREAWPSDKSLTLIPEIYRMALAYGINPLTGRTTPRWRIRNVIRWVRPNPPVGALSDKFRPGTSDMVIACGTDEAGRARYFDLDAVRTPLTDPGADARFAGTRNQHDRAREDVGLSSGNGFTAQNAAGAPPLDWWKISPKGFDGAHFATYPPELCERPIKAMCPQRVCTTCGQPSRRVTAGFTLDSYRASTRPPTEVTRDSSWTDCGHDTWRTGTVLDPFAGSGTTLAVATGHGRHAIGIDLDRRNVDLARERIGPMFFAERTVEDIAAESLRLLPPATAEDIRADEQDARAADHQMREEL